MAVDSTTAFKNISDRPVSLPPGGDVLTTPETIARLQISDKEALSPANVLQFLAGQYAQFDHIVNRPLIKMEAAEIPEYIHDERQPVVTALSTDEQTALNDWRSDAKAMLMAQSNPSSGGALGTSTGTSTGTSSGGSSGTDDLSKQIEQFVDGVAKNNPDAFTKGSGMSGPDILGDMLSGEIYQDTAETKQKLHELLAAAKDPESVIMALAWHQSMKTANLMGRAFEALKFQQDGLMKLEAEMNLNGKMMDQSTLMQKNLQFSQFSTSSSQIYQVIQQGMNQYEQTFTLSNSLLKDHKQSDNVIIQNMKT